MKLCTAITGLSAISLMNVSLTKVDARKEFCPCCRLVSKILSGRNKKLPAAIAGSEVELKFASNGGRIGIPVTTRSAS